MEIALIGSDMHLGEHNPRYIDTFLALVAKLKPRRVVLAGDILDCTELHKSTRGTRQPVRTGRSSLQVGEELVVARLVLKALRSAAPKARIHYIEGNHELRYPRVLAQSAPEMFSTIPVLPELLELKQLGIDWVPENDILTFPGWRAAHGSRCTANAARLDGRAGQGGFVQGHTHRLSCCGETDPATGLVRWYVEAGHLRDPQASYTRHRRPDWQAGCVALVDGMPVLIPFRVDGSATFGTTLVTPRDTPAPSLWSLASRQIATQRKREIDKAVKGKLWTKSTSL